MEHLLLELNHSAVKDTYQEVILQGPIQKLHPTVYDNIDGELIKKAAIRTKEVFGLSRLDADG